MLSVFISRCPSQCFNLSMFTKEVDTIINNEDRKEF